MPAPLSTGSCPSHFLSPSLHFAWDLEPRQRGGIFAKSSSLPWSGKEQPVSMPSYISFLWQNIFLIFQINFFSSVLLGCGRVLAWLWSQLLAKLASQPVSGACLLQPFCINLLLHLAQMDDGGESCPVYGI